MVRIANVLVLLGGELDPGYSIRATAWDRIIAADRGVQHALARRLFPDLVVGDFDSAEAAWLRSLPATTSIERLPRDKDVTDGEQAVERALALRPRRIVLAGALGGRIDHTLANLLLLDRIEASGVEGWATDGVQRVFLLRSSVTFVGEVGDTVSIIPLGGHLEGVITMGLRWPLDRETLHFGAGRGVSNILVTPQAKVTCTHGMGLVIHTPQQFVGAPAPGEENNPK